MNSNKRNRNNYQSYNKEDAPETLENSIFYGIPLDDDQRIFRDAIYDKDKLVVVCNAKAGTGKAQPINTIIPTPSGYRYLGDIKIGDFVFDRSGNPTRVLGVFPQGKQRAYKVTLSDGRYTICGPEHLWSFRCNWSNKIRTESINQMLTRSIRDNSGASRYKIPNNNPVYYNTKNYNIDPYIIGVLLGDGCCTETYLSISSPELEIINEVARLTLSKPVKYTESNYTWKFKDRNNHLIKTDTYLSNVSDCLINYSCYKRIPNEYLLGDIEQRFSLLQGLLDTDGSISYAGGRYNIRYTTTSYNLAQDVLQLAFSLGMSASMLVDNREDRYTNNACYNISFKVPNTVKPLMFRKSFKKSIAIESLNYEKSRIYEFNIISSIEDLGYEEEMVCIYVDNPEHLYLTNDFIVTHNTTVALGVANLLVQYGFYDGIVYIAFPTQEQRQGYLPGSAEEKNAPYMQPLVEALYTLNIIPEQAIMSESNMQAMKNGTAYIQFTTDTYLRGCNFENKVVIIDEAQNSYYDTMKKTLTRIHDNCKVVLIGHTEQCDLYKHQEKSGFRPYLNAFSKCGDSRVQICELKTNHRGWISTFCDNVGFE